MPARTLRPPAALAVLVLVALGGCTTRYVAEPAVGFDLAGPIAIDADVFNGDVTVRVDPDVPRADVLVVRETLDTMSEPDVALAALEAIAWSAEIVGGALGRTLEVRATTASDGAWMQRLHVTIIVPRADGVTVRTGRGDIDLRGVAGAIDARTGEGEVRLVTARPLRERVALASGLGDVVLRCRAESQGRLDLSAERGSVVHRVQRGRVRIDPGSGASMVTGTLNDGTNVIEMRATEGDVHLAVVEDPETHGRYIVP